MATSREMIGNKPVGMLAQTILDAYRCPPELVDLATTEDFLGDAGFFKFGPEAVCYGAAQTGKTKNKCRDLTDLIDSVEFSGSKIKLPFNPSEIVENLRLERYPGTRHSRLNALARKSYYRLRPLLHDSIRRQIQKYQLRGWRGQDFPAWPVDFNVEKIHQRLLSLAMQAKGIDRIPFIWFWPGRHEACVAMTHDVERREGLEFCDDLMDLDDGHGIKASFQFVPRGSYKLSPALLSRVRNRGFEVGLQDFSHDGRLYDDYKEFLRRAEIINQCAREYGARGFRSAVLYRRPEWFEAFEFSFDMSIPNTARLDPQRGGCCTVFPYFIGNILELPVTTVQDYMLFTLIGEKSIDLWKIQIDSIVNQKGLVSFIVHPDYLLDGEVKALYQQLLSHLGEIRASKNLWFAIPSEIDNWWRQRSKLHLFSDGENWTIEGEGADRAVVAYARQVSGNLVYEFGSQLGHASAKES